MEAELTIRVAGLKDMNIICELALQVWPETYKDILPKEQLDYMLELFYSTSSLTKQMTEQHHCFLLASINGIPAGFASFGLAKPINVYKLHKIYIKTTIQGKGLGKTLIEAVTAEIKTLGGTVLLLNVNRHNKAKTFYEKLGFRVIKEEDIDIGNGYFMNDYVMERML